MNLSVESWPLKRVRWLLFFVPLVLAGPFLNRAYFVDDSYFVEIAHWIKDNPTLPYHFRADDDGPQTRGWEENGFVRMVNPLAHHYYLALLLKIGGEREWFLRLGCVLLSCFSAVFIFELARRWTRYPILATLLALVTPTFWLSSYSLLIDSTAGFFFLGGLFLFIRAAEKDRVGDYVWSGILMGLAILSKYPSGLVVPLSATWLVLNWKKVARPGWGAMAWIIAALILVVYSAYTTHLYGSPHILAASKRMVQVYGWPKLLVLMIFISGVTLTPLVAWSTLHRGFIYAASLMTAGAVYFLISPAGGYTLLQSILIAVWTMSTLLFMAAIPMVWKKLTIPNDLFLALWFWEFVLMMVVVMGWVAGRYFVIAVPAVVFLSVRLVEIRWPKHTLQILQASLAVTFVVTAAMGYADYQQAETSRKLIRDLNQAGIKPGPRSFYTGDSFTVSYLKKEGWTPSFTNTQFQVGDQILVKQVTMPSISFMKSPIVINKLAIFEYPSKFPIKVMDMEGSAGFYASVWGALPFTWSWGPWERFHLFEVVGLKAQTAVKEQ